MDEHEAESGVDQSAELEKLGRYLLGIEPEPLMILAVIRSQMRERDCDILDAIASFDDATIPKVISAVREVWQALLKTVAPVSRPTQLGGGLAGEGADNPFGRGDVIIDTRESVIIDACDVAMVDGARDEDGGRVGAMWMRGRVNRRVDRAEILYLLSPDQAAEVVSQLMGLAQRDPEREWGDEFGRCLARRVGDLPEAPDG